MVTYMDNSPNKGLCIYALRGLPLIGSRGRRLADALASPDGDQDQWEDLGG